MVKNKLVSRAWMTVSIVFLVAGALIASASYMLHKRIGLSYAVWIRDLSVEILGAWAWTMMGAIIFILAGTVGLISRKKWMVK